VLCVGAAGSLTESVKPGDLVIAEETIEHDFQLKFVQRPLPTFKADPMLLETAKKLLNSHRHLGAVASGDEDVADSRRAQEISRKTGALAVAWEGAGGARACAFHRIPYMEVRAITDFADKAAASDFRTHLQAGLSAAAAFLHEFAAR
jgi:adenosylhomocysteine nucleosidase